MDLVKLSKISDSAVSDSSQKDVERMIYLCNKDNVKGHAAAMAKSIKSVDKLIDRLGGLPEAIKQCSPSHYTSYIIMREFSSRVEELDPSKLVEVEKIQKEVDEAFKENAEKEKESKKKKEEEQKQLYSEFTSPDNLKAIANLVLSKLTEKYGVSGGKITGKGKVQLSVKDKIGDEFVLYLVPGETQLGWKLDIKKPSWWRTSVHAGFGEATPRKSVESSNDELVNTVMSWYSIVFDLSRSEKLSMM